MINHTFMGWFNHGPGTHEKTHTIQVTHHTMNPWHRESWREVVRVFLHRKNAWIFQPQVSTNVA